MIRKARLSDLTTLVKIEEKCFTYDRLPKEEFTTYLTGNDFLFLVKIVDQKIIGYILAFFYPHWKAARFYSLAVLPKMRGKGYALALMNHAEKEIRKKRYKTITLQVKTQNENAIRLYKNMGYKPLRKLPGYYDDGSDGLKMRKTL